MTFYQYIRREVWLLADPAGGRTSMADGIRDARWTLRVASDAIQT